jgi:hypothetical protein
MRCAPSNKSFERFANSLAERTRQPAVETLNSPVCMDDT